MSMPMQCHENQNRRLLLQASKKLVGVCKIEVKLKKYILYSKCYTFTIHCHNFRELHANFLLPTMHRIQCAERLIQIQ